MFYTLPYSTMDDQDLGYIINIVADKFNLEKLDAVLLQSSVIGYRFNTNNDDVEDIIRYILNETYVITRADFSTEEFVEQYLPEISQEYNAYKRHAVIEKITA